MDSSLLEKDAFAYSQLWINWYEVYVFVYHYCIIILFVSIYLFIIIVYIIVFVYVFEPTRLSNRPATCK